ncbi:MAG: hydantoinase B/oxoprolinase family protein [Desulfobacteraceae bacterium]|nr:hydantoinase B/oxoprolinase family protein [Desulfobacteraceae bacterium]
MPQTPDALNTDKEGFDPITAEIIQSSLQAAADEMFAAMRRTAMSAIIYEVLDMGTAICDKQGQLAGSGAGIPAFVGMLDKSVHKVIEKFHQPDDIKPGDIFITNDPFTGGVTHLNDVVVVMPVFAEDEIVAWTANMAHWNDIGGMVPGSMSTEATEIYQEGLQLPAIKLFSRNQPIQPIFDILEANSRMPDFMRGDLWAGIASIRVGERRVLELIRKYGKAVFLHAIEKYMDYGEQVTLGALRNLPHGIFELDEEQDDGRVLHVRIEISDNAFVVDLTNNPDQDKGPFNISRDGSIVAAQMVLKSVTSPGTVCNGGSYRPLQVLTRPGSCFDPHRPAAMGIYYELDIRLYDLIWRALAEHMPTLLPSGGFASICGTLFGGVHPDTGRQYSVIEPELGGWGGSATGDGNPAIFSGFHGETYNCPAEISEARNGVVVDRMSFHDEEGGEGKHRGGKGVCIEYRIRSDNAWFTAAYTRFKFPPWPLEGGRNGSPNYVEVLRADGKVERYSAVSGVVLNTDDVIRVVTGTGAGWGNPIERDSDRVRDDLKNGYITPEQAEKYYGFENS